MNFNKSFGVEYFPVCEWLLTEAPRIRSLRNPQLKMSKSDTSDKSRINLDDTEEEIKAKIRVAVTDNTSRVCNLVKAGVARGNNSRSRIWGSPLDLSSLDMTRLCAEVSHL